MDSKTAPASPSTLRSLLPALVFVLGLLVLVVAAYDTSYSALPPSEKRYTTTRTDVEILKADAKRSAHRDQWLKLAEEFYDIYTRDSQWPNRPAALFRSAEVMEELGKRSFAPRDFRLAVERYELLAEKHAASRLADDALLRAAIIRAERLNDRDGALRILRRIRTQYPRADMAPEAAKVEKALLAQNAVPPTASPTAPRAPGKEGAASRQQGKKQDAELTRISWATLGRNKVQITVELDRHAPWQVRMREGGKGRPARLTLEMRDTIPVEQVRSGARIKDSLLTRVLVKHDKTKTTSLAFDFTSARRYDAKVEQHPFRIVLTVLAGNAMPARGAGPRVGFAELRTPSPDSAYLRQPRRHAGQAQASRQASGRQAAPAVSAKNAVSEDMAAQLGLTVQSVFIDAGHGGKDPGTLHNSVVERELVLDISRRVGRLLAANGLDVHYSRTSNVGVALSARPRKANSLRADLFVSIHVNANNDASVSGFETFYLDLARSTHAARVATLENAASDRKLGDMQSVLADVMLSSRTQESSRLAGDIQRAALFRLAHRGFEVRNGGSRSAPFHVLIGAGMPAVLVEVGYCTNVKEAKRLASPQYRHALAEGIAEGILAYRNRLQHRHSAQFTLTGRGEGAI